MTHFSRSTWTPLGIAPLLVPSVVILGIALVGGIESWSQQHLAWPATSGLIHEHLYWAGPVAAAAATYYAAQLNKRGAIFHHRFADRLVSAIAVRHFAVLCLVFTITYIIGQTPLLALTTKRAVGGPDLLSMGSGVTGLWALVAIGYMIGTISGQVWTTPFAFVGCLIIVTLPLYFERMAAVIPVTTVKLWFGVVEPITFSVYRITFFVVVVVLLAYISARSVQQLRLWALLAPSAVLLAIVGFFASVPLIWEIPSVANEPNPGETCELDGDIRYCVHAGRGSLLNQLIEDVSSVFADFGVPDMLTDVKDDALIADIDTLELSVMPVTVDDSQVSVAYYLSGSQSCPWIEDEVAESEVLALQLAGSLLRSMGVVGYERPDSPFRAMTARELSNWMDVHRSAIDGCRLKVEDLQ